MTNPDPTLFEVSASAIAALTESGQIEFIHVTKGGTK